MMVQPTEKRSPSSGQHRSAPRATSTTMWSRRKVTSNVRLLSVYLEPSLYEKGVKFIAQMNRYYVVRDPVRFKLYLDVFAKLVLDDEVAKFRAEKMIDKLYGDLIAQFR